MNAHAIIERALDRHGVDATLMRVGTTDVEVPIRIGAVQYQESKINMGGANEGRRQRWLIPARRLAATAIPTPRVGDFILLSESTERVVVVAAGYANNAVVRWDVQTEGVGL